MRQKRIWAALAALMMAASLAGCTEKDSSGIAETETDTSVITENTESSTDGTAEGTTEASESGTQSDTEQSETAAKTDGTASSGKSSTEPAVSGVTEYEDVPEAGKPAYDVLTGFLEACRAGDADKIIAASNLDAFAEAEGETDVRGIAKEMKIEQYWIGGCAENKTILGLYREYRADALDRISRLEGEDKQRAQSYMKVLPDIDSVWRFNVTMKASADGEKKEHPFYVVHMKDGWKVDVCVLDAMSGYVGKSEITKANSVARMISNAFNSALIDADATGYKVSVLAGDYDLTGNAFKGLKAPDSSKAENADKTAVLNYVLYNVQQYYNEITDVTLMKISIGSNGTVKGVAVAHGSMPDAETGKTQYVFGTYPRQMTKDDLNNVRTLQQALDYVKREG